MKKDGLYNTSMEKKIKLKKGGQIWVETVVYTLIGMALIGVALAIVTPQLNKQRDRALVEQTISALNVFDEKMTYVIDKGPGNVRNLDFNVKRGKLIINSTEEVVYFIIDDLSSLYSQENIVINRGMISFKSKKERKGASIVLWLNYSSSVNITYRGREEQRVFNPASTPYKISIENLGAVNGLNEPFVIDIK